jgi:hypothetical protein
MSMLLEEHKCTLDDLRIDVENTMQLSKVMLDSSFFFINTTMMEVKRISNVKANASGNVQSTTNSSR